MVVQISYKFSTDLSKELERLPYLPINLNILRYYLWQVPFILICEDYHQVFYPLLPEQRCSSGFIPLKSRLRWQIIVSGAAVFWKLNNVMTA